jgi:hypothetical protein
MGASHRRKKRFKIWKTKRCKRAKIHGCRKPAWSPRCHLCRQRNTSRGGYTLVQWYPRFAPELADRCVVLHRNHRRFLNPSPAPGTDHPCALARADPVSLAETGRKHTAVGLRQGGATQPVSAGAKVSLMGRLGRTEVSVAASVAAAALPQRQHPRPQSPSQVPQCNLRMRPALLQIPSVADCCASRYIGCQGHDGSGPADG